MTGGIQKKNHGVMAVKGVRAGDYIAFLYGVETLHIIRSDRDFESRYRLMGYCCLERSQHTEDHLLNQETVIALC